MSSDKLYEVEIGDWVHLKWQDACIYSPLPEGDGSLLMDVDSVGHVSIIDDEQIILSQSTYRHYDGVVEARDGIAIPRAWITYARVLNLRGLPHPATESKEA